MFCVHVCSVVCKLSKLINRVSFDQRLFQNQPDILTPRWPSTLAPKERPLAGDESGWRRTASNRIRHRTHFFVRSVAAKCWSQKSAAGDLRWSWIRHRLQIDFMPASVTRREAENWAKLAIRLSFRQYPPFYRSRLHAQSKADFPGRNSAGKVKFSRCDWGVRRGDIANGRGYILTWVLWK